jgi:hypothetical protein
MILSLALLFSLEATYLCSTIYNVKTGNWLFSKIMSYILSVVYGLTIIIYIPLFATVMERLRVAFPQIHS